MIAPLQALNYVIKTKDYQSIFTDGIDGTYFGRFSSIYDFVKNHIDKYGDVPDYATVKDNFKNFEIVEVTESPTYLRDALREEKAKDILVENYSLIAEAIKKSDITEATNLVQETSQKLRTNKSLECVDIAHDTSRYEDFLSVCENKEKYFIKTGFDELDVVIGGWDAKEELATIVARTNMGKSWCLIKSALAALNQGLNVGLYSGEMTVNKVAYRFDTLNGHFSNFGLNKGNRELQNTYKNYLDNLSSNTKGTLKVLTPTMLGRSAGVNDLRDFIEKESLDILFVDQHSLLEDDHNAKNPIEKAANISKDLKNIQVLLGKPIISACQQNRSSTENGVGTEHIAQSDRIGQDSTTIIFFEKDEDLVTLTLGKSRDSVNNKKLRYTVDLDHGIFEYQPEEDNAINGEGSSALIEEFEDPNTYNFNPETPF